MAKICFAQEMYFPLQSTQCLSAHLKRAGHQTDVAIGSPEEIVKYIQETKPDLIGFSVLTAYRNHMLATVTAIKEAGITTPVIAGGYDITFMPQIIDHSDLDMICVSDGGKPVTELVDWIASGKDWRDNEIPNIHVKQRDGSVRRNPMRYWEMDLDAAPWDDRDIYWNKDPYFKIIPFTQVLAGRGCPYPCTYCFNDGYKKIHMDNGMKSKDYAKFRSVGSVIEELKWLEKTYNSKYFFFNDSTLTWNTKWIIEFCEEYKKAGIKATFAINAVIPELNDEVIAALASTKKCKLIRFGLETGNEDFRNKTLRKSIKNELIYETVRKLEANGLRYSMQMMLGLPGETLEYAWDSIDVARKATGKRGVHGINIFKPFPGLEINNVGLELGMYQASDVVAPGSVPPPTWRKESLEDTPDTKKDVVLPSDEGYLASRGAGMQATSQASNTADSDLTGLDEYRQHIAITNKKAKGVDEIAGTKALGTLDMVFYDNYRRDKLGLKILKLSRYSHLLIRFPNLRPIVEKIIELPDNAFNRFVWMVTEGLLNIRVHAGAPWSYFIKYFLFHSGKRVR